MLEDFRTEAVFDEDDFLANDVIRQIILQPVVLFTRRFIRAKTLRNVDESCVTAQVDRAYI